MPIRIVQLGSPRYRDEGIRFGTVRRPPRGVRKTQYAKENWYDVWLPKLSPSEELLRKKLVRQAENKSRQVGMKFDASVELSQAHSAAGLVRSTTGWRNFERSFRAECGRLKKMDTNA
jgi:uncharacterized protein YeaO (DUF488 family)